jgi:hypothetical protein
MKRPTSSGNVRLVVQVYRPELRGYRDEGLSIAKIPIRNRRELRRLWKRLTELVEGRGWTDLTQRQISHSADAGAGDG